MRCAWCFNHCHHQSITSIPQTERSLPVGEHQQAATALPRWNSSRWGSQHLVFVLALVIWKGRGAQHFIFLSFWGKEMRKKYGQTELNSPSNLPTVKFDRRANGREEQSGTKSPWSCIIKYPENMLSWLEVLPPPTVGIKVGHQPRAVCARTGWQRIQIYLLSDL